MILRIVRPIVNHFVTTRLSSLPSFRAHLSPGFLLKKHLRTQRLLSLRVGILLSFLNKSWCMNIWHLLKPFPIRKVKDPLLLR